MDILQYIPKFSSKTDSEEAVLSKVKKLLKNRYDCECRIYDLRTPTRHPLFQKMMPRLVGKDYYIKGEFCYYAIKMKKSQSIGVLEISPVGHISPLNLMKIKEIVELVVEPYFLYKDRIEMIKELEEQLEMVSPRGKVLYLNREVPPSEDYSSHLIGEMDRCMDSTMNFMTEQVMDCKNPVVVTDCKDEERIFRKALDIHYDLPQASFAPLSELGWSSLESELQLAKLKGVTLYVPNLLKLSSSQVDHLKILLQKDIAKPHFILGIVERDLGDSHKNEILNKFLEGLDVHSVRSD